MNGRLTVGLMVIVLAGCTREREEGTGLTRADFPDQESWNPTIILTREGKKRAVVESGHLAKHNDRQEVILDEQVIADFFSTLEEHMSTLTSREARVFEATDNLLALGDVVVVSDSGVTLYTDSLYWDNRAEKITTRDTVMLTTETQDTLYGIGFESNVDLTHWKIFNPWGVTER